MQWYIPSCLPHANLPDVMTEATAVMPWHFSSLATVADSSHVLSAEEGRNGHACHLANESNEVSHLQVDSESVANARALLIHLLGLAGLFR